ncbi:MAG: matrixin family metalloprotease [Planctomycetota bacterium]
MKWPSKPTVATAALLGSLLGALFAVYGRLGDTPVGLGGGAPAPKGLVVVGSPAGGGGWITLYRGLDAPAIGRTQVPWQAYADHRGEVRPVAAQLDTDADLEVVVGLGDGGDGAFAVLDDPGHGCKLLAWKRVPWSDYAKAGGATRVALGDVDGDGKDEIVVGCSRSGVAYVFDDAAKDFALLATLSVPWKAYNEASGEVRPAAGDLDGDGKDEVVLGLADGAKSGGWMAVYRELNVLSWARLPWSEANERDLGTWPSIGDVDGDGQGELVVGTGPGGGACVAVIADVYGDNRVTWTRVPWSDYAEAAGEARPSCADLDTDGRSELTVLLAEGTSMTNVAALLDDSKSSHVLLAWRTAWSAVIVAQAREAAGKADRVVRLKSRSFIPPLGVEVPEPTGPVGSRRHFLIQFHGDLAALIEALRAKGIDAVAMVGSDVVSVSAPIGATLEGVEGVDAAFLLEPQDRLSRLSYDTVEEKGATSVAVEFHADVAQSEADRVLQAMGLAPVHCAGLPGHVVVAKVDIEHLESVSRHETVGYVIPASDPMAAGEEAFWCAGQSSGPLPPAEYSLEGAPGWDGSGAGSTTLTYYFGTPTADLSQATQRSELVRAIGTWSRYVVVNWNSTSSPALANSMDIHFGPDTHAGCPYNFGQYVLAHCFFPWSNSLGGDMHVNEAYTWHVGSDYDLYSVALHESGHGLGLGHSADPNAVMYPTYIGVVNDLRSDDIAGIRQLYQTGVGAVNGGAGGGGGGGGGGTTPTDDYGNTPSTAANLTIGANAVAGRIEAAGDVDFFYVNCMQSYTYRVFTNTLTNGMDSVLTVYQPNGTTVVMENNNVDGGLASRVQWTAAASGRHYIRVRHASSTGTGDYRIGASQPDDHGNTSATATLLRLLYAPTPGSISPSGDVDWFRFYGTAGRSTVVETSGLSPSTMDTLLRLYNASGVLLTTNDNASASTKASRITLTLPYTGWYYVRCSHMTWGVGTYSIGVR